MFVDTVSPIVWEHVKNVVRPLVDGRTDFGMAVEVDYKGRRVVSKTAARFSGYDDPLLRHCATRSRGDRSARLGYGATCEPGR